MYLQEIKAAHSETLSDEEIALRCLDYASRSGTNYTISLAQEMFDWVKRKRKKEDD